MVSADLAKGLQKKRVNQDKWDHFNWLTAVVVSLPNNKHVLFFVSVYIHSFSFLFLSVSYDTRS